MSGEPEMPSSDTTRTGTPRQDVPAASAPVLPSAHERRDRSDVARYAGVGFQFALTLLVGLGLGTLADRKFGTSIFVLIGVFLGAGAAFYSMYRQLMGNLERDEAARRAQKRAEAEPSRESRGREGGE